MRSPTPVACTIPLSSALQPSVVAGAYYWDSYRAPLKTPPVSVIDVFFGVFGHHPRWMRAALMARNRLVRLLGLNVPAAEDDFEASRRNHYEVGHLIGRWPIYALNEQELIAGQDNSHLDFRVSILRELGNTHPSVVISTVCIVHNWTGKVYLFFVLPFHRFGVRYIISQALQAGRL
jgi:hypothetical protein